MSLLMDALKRAETSKQEAARLQGGKDAAATAPDSGLSLEPLPRETATSGGPLPDLAAHLEAVDAELASSAQPRIAAAKPELAPAFTATAANGQAIARNAFAAKQEAPADQRRGLWLALAGLGLAGLGIAGYVWYQLNALGSGSLAPAGGQQPIASAPPRLADSLPVPTSPPPASQPAPAESLFQPPPAAPVARPTPPPRAEATEAAAPIRLSRTQARPDPELAQGHAQLQAGDLAQASRHFAQALQRDPNNTDALLALAAIAQYQGRPGDAEGWRQRALVADPSDPAVQAAALGGRAAGTDPQATESRLKTLLAAQPQSAELNFTLGNLYARQRRWAEAQQAYFNAVAADADNPDYLFNLAVSLDQLRQPRPAAQHYRLALEAAARRPAAFDGEQVRRRLADLQP